MRQLGEMIRASGRSYIALSATLSIGCLIALFLPVAAGQRRLEAANSRVRESQVREQALNDYVAMMPSAGSRSPSQLL